MNDILKTQKIATLLIEAKELELQYIRDKQPQRKIAGVRDSCTQFIIDLIEEGIPYEFIKSDEGREKDTVRITIDGQAFDCRNNDVYDALKDSYASVMGESYRQLTGEHPDEAIKGENGVNNSGFAPRNAPYPTIILQQPVQGKSDEDIKKEMQEKEEELRKNIVAEEMQKLIPPKIYLNGEDEVKEIDETSSFAKKAIRVAIKIMFFAVVLVGIYLAYLNRSEITDFIKGLQEKYSTSSEEATAGTLDDVTSVISVEDLKQFSRNPVSFS